ncbi:hypothetical protein [Microbispora sp. H13382]|uniref:hypothetical protein n=1 Tax=Microbispora sp. H13382 TaxID=2729112 RepID=UPI0016018925|nr:hypothetical protein [Microbispora sp. H13382]
MDYDLAGLGPKAFERLCQALAIKILGADVQVFGSGPDGGREASFDGQLTYPDPSPNGPWGGYGVLQAKYKEQLSSAGNDLAWLRKQIKAELDAWADPTKRRRKEGRSPQYLIFATNVSLSAVPGGGGKDKISMLITQSADVIGLKDWRVWDANQIKSFLDVHQDVATGFAALITPHALIAALREKVMQSAPLIMPTPIKVGEGLPGKEAAFRAAFEAAGGVARLGHPTGQAHELGPGFVQYLRNADSAHDSVLCALDNHQSAVVVAGPVWKALSNLGDPSLGGGVVDAGFPSAEEGGDTCYIGEDLPRIELSGGRWGPGYIIRVGPERWKWRPQVRFDSLAFRDRTIWAGVKADLRIRVAARIPWPVAMMRIDSAGRRRVEAALAASEAIEALHVLGHPRGLTAQNPVWQRTSDSDGRNDSYGVSQQCGLNGPDGRHAITGRALFQLPTLPIDDTALSLVDVRVDFDALRQGTTDTAVPAELRITIPELANIFTAAWTLATTVLPLAVTADPTTVTPTGAPRLELYVVNERPVTEGGDRTLRTDQLLDLTAFGTTTRTHLYDLAIGVAAPLDLTDAEIDSTVKLAMVRMAEDYGFTDADRLFLQ